MITMQDILATVALNGFLLAVIVLAVWMWRRRRPMTKEKLRRVLAHGTKPTDAAPLDGDFCCMLELERALHDSGAPLIAVTALLLGWAAEGKITLCETEKKRFKSYGDAVQATIQFPDSEDEPFAPPQDGAEGLLLSLLYGWADETATLQESELYNDAREYHEAVFARLEQLSVQGRHGLRAAGVVELEQKTRKFGFADAHRTLYTPRGVRTAAQMKGYRMWMDKQSSLPPEKWRDAALLGAFEQIDNVQFELAESIADALINGAMAGENAEKR